MDDQTNKEDVDVFVSPRRFVGCTPGPKATKQKIFEDNQRKENAAKGQKINFDLEDVKYANEFRDSRGDIHRKVARNNAVSLAVLIVNYIIIVLGIILISVSIWVALGERNGGIAAYTFRRGFFIRSPLVLGIFLFIGGSATILLGFFYGVKYLAPSIVQGIHEPRNRVPLVRFQIVTSISVLLFGTMLFSVIVPLHHVRQHEITATLWREMSVHHPQRICQYELANGCAGSRNNSCSLPTASKNPACPGHYCESTCSAGSSKPNKNESTCRSCIESLSSSDELRKCRQSESGKGTSGTCIPILGSELRKYFTVLIIATSIGLATMLCLIVLGTLGPLLSING